MGLLKAPRSLFVCSLLIGALSLSACTTGEPEETAPNAGGGRQAGLMPHDEFRDWATGAVAGKTIAWVPVGQGTPLIDEWTYQIETLAEQFDMEFVMRDPNWDPAAQVQAVEALIAERPDVLVVHNLDQSSLAGAIEKAQGEGIYVIQVNMSSNYKSDAFVGMDAVQYGMNVAADVVESCGEGTSGQVAIVLGDATSSLNTEYMEGWERGIEGHDEIEVVAEQTANWDRTKSNEIVSTILQKYPDLCAIMGGWDEMDFGAATAAREANSSVKVFSIGGSTTACDGVESGLFEKVYNQHAAQQGQMVVAMARYLLQSGEPAGSSMSAIYVPITEINESNASNPATCYTGKGTSN